MLVSSKSGGACCVLSPRKLGCTRGSQQQQQQTDVLNRINDHSQLKLAELLPHNWKPLEKFQKTASQTDDVLRAALTIKVARIDAEIGIVRIFYKAPQAARLSRCRRILRDLARFLFKSSIGNYV